MTTSGIQALLVRLEKERSKRSALDRAFERLNTPGRSVWIYGDHGNAGIDVDDPKIREAIQAALKEQSDRLSEWIRRTERRIARWK